MKVLMKPIDMIVWFDKDGNVNPLRYRVEGVEGEYKVVKIERVIYKKEERLAGTPMLIFRCQSVVENCERLYELKYDFKGKWYLYKM
ncbi:hypothetical protein PRVXH_001294 [Proteinivorax hydrogeniformans]|uniref:Uncharacterized protein n=1 Tax=Proteinivorax hydrogeniformans TaxID=1826727 RepID=A0AAU8HX62_9FIRM